MEVEWLRSLGVVKLDVVLAESHKRGEADINPTLGNLRKSPHHELQVARSIHSQGHGSSRRTDPCGPYLLPWLPAASSNPSHSQPPSFQLHPLPQDESVLQLSSISNSNDCKMKSC